nr:immunoglobulin light chain junction region [Macaca mulatta]
YYYCASYRSGSTCLF